MQDTQKALIICFVIFFYLFIHHLRAYQKYGDDTYILPYFMISVICLVAFIMEC